MLFISTPLSLQMHSRQAEYPFPADRVRNTSEAGDSHNAKQRPGSQTQAISSPRRRDCGKSLLGLAKP